MAIALTAQKKTKRKCEVLLQVFMEVKMMKKLNSAAKKAGITKAAYVRQIFKEIL